LKKVFISAVIASLFSAPILAADYTNDIVAPSKLETSLQDIVKRIDLQSIKNDQVINGTTSKTVIDLMAFYQPIYADMMGNQATHDRIEFMVSLTNSALENSNIPVEVRLVNAQPIIGIPDSLQYNSILDEDGYEVEPGAAALFSERVLSSSGPDGGFPENNAVTAFGADLIVYYRDNRKQDKDPLGQASLGRELSTVFDVNASRDNQTVSDGTLAHEIGHNLNAGHEIDANDNIVYPSEDAHAYNCDLRNTIMWSMSEDNKHIMYSNPDIVANVIPCGDSTYANNSRVISENALIAAQRKVAPPVAGTVSFTERLYTVNENEDATVKITRTGDLSVETSVQVALIDETAIEGADFTTSFERINFPVGESVHILMLN
jgi:hypothetical protein